MIAAAFVAATMFIMLATPSTGHATLRSQLFSVLMQAIELPTQLLASLEIGVSTPGLENLPLTTHTQQSAISDIGDFMMTKTPTDENNNTAENVVSISEKKSDKAGCWLDGKLYSEGAFVDILCRGGSMVCGFRPSTLPPIRHKCVKGKWQKI